MSAIEQASTSKIPKGLMGLIWILVLGAFAPLLDSTIVNVALPTINHALNASVNTSQWTITGYLLAMGVVIPISAWLLERLGGKKLWLISLFMFLIGTILSSLAWNMPSLIAFRIIQGAAAGIITPLVMTMALREAHGLPLTSIMSTATLPMVLVPVLGPVIGGFIVNDLNWQWIFYVNVPILIVAIILAWWKLPKETPTKEKHPLDILGFLMLAPSVALIFYGLSNASEHAGFGSRSVLEPLIIGLVLMMAFVIYALIKKHPLIDLRPFKIRAFSASIAILFIAGLTIYGPLLLISLFYQNDQHQTALMAGILLAPQGLGSLIPRLFTGKLVDKFGSKAVILVGLIITVLGTLPFALATATTNKWLLASILFVRGLGLTPLTIAVMANAFQGVPKDEIPNASSTTRIIQQVGGSFGTAILVVILTQAAMTHRIYSQAFNVAFWWAIGLAALAIIPTLLLPRVIKVSKE